MGIWDHCVDFLKGELAPAEYNTWILPLQAAEEGSRLRLFAPNRFGKEWVENSYRARILEKTGARNDVELALLARGTPAE